MMKATGDCYVGWQRLVCMHRESLHADNAALLRHDEGGVLCMQGV